MKRNIVYLLIVGVLLIFTSCNQSNSKTKSDRGRSITESNELYGLVHYSDRVKSSILDSCFNKSKFILPAGVKVTPKMYQLLRYSNYKTTCEIVKNEIGILSNEELVDGFFSKDGLLVVYRYKFYAVNSDIPFELRITFTKEKKLTEFQFYQWNDTYVEDLVQMNWF